MECLNSHKIQEYIEGGLNAVEKAMIRDHLILCEKCKLRYESFNNIEACLAEPVYVTPPDVIRQNVLKTLFPRIPSLSSVLALIAATVTLVVTWIYVYFDFANNSIVQALELTSNKTSNWIGAIIKFISTVFSAVYAIFKVMNAFIDAVFKVNVGVEIIGLFTLASLFTVFYFFSHKLYKKLKGLNG